MAALSVIGILVGSIGPWASFGGLVQVSGVEGDGALTLGLSLIAALCLAFALRREKPSKSAALAACAVGILCSLIAGYHVVDFGSLVSWGLWLTAAGSVALAVAAKLLAEQISDRARP